MAITVVLNAETLERVAVCTNKKQLKEFAGDEFVFVTKDSFSESDKYPTWDEMQGKEPKPVKEPSERAPRTSLPEDSQYEIVKPLPGVAEDHPKAPIWEAIANNVTISGAKADCPAENPKRKTSGSYSFTSEFRYFLRTGYIKLV